MDKIGFDSKKYLTMQSECIDKRIKEFGGKLYLEFGGKLFDDFHASRVLPGFAPDSICTGGQFRSGSLYRDFRHGSGHQRAEFL